MPKSKDKILGLHRLIPNILTLLAMTAGLTAIQFSINGRFEEAVIAILVATILDGLDGATARLVNATSDFGAQLDNLSDLVAFGVAPAFVLYLWVLQDAGQIGWAATLVFALATSLRLARFSVLQKQAAQRPAWARNYFSGVPSPAGAGLALLPMIIWFQFPETFTALSFATPLVALWTLFVAGLMISRIPTFSTKQIRLHVKMALPILAATILLVAFVVHAPWPTLTAIGILYLVCLPWAVIRFRKIQARHAQDAEDFTDLAIGAVIMEHLSGTEDDKG